MVNFLENHKTDQLVQFFINLRTPDVRGVVFNVLPWVPDNFWTASEDSSHPNDETKEGGVLLHVFRTIRVAELLAEPMGISKEDLDYVIGAIALSESFKNSTEDYIFAICNLILEKNNSNEASKKIMSLIDNKGNKSNLQKFIRLCDFVASQKTWHIPVTEEMTNKCAKCIHNYEYCQMHSDSLTCNNFCQISDVEMTFDEKGTGEFSPEKEEEMKPW